MTKFKINLNIYSKKGKWKEMENPVWVEKTQCQTLRLCTSGLLCPPSVPWGQVTAVSDFQLKETENGKRCTTPFLIRQIKCRLYLAIVTYLKEPIENRVNWTQGTLWQCERKSRLGFYWASCNIIKHYPLINVMSLISEKLRTGGVTQWV